MRNKDVGGVAADGEGKHVLHLGMLQPLLCHTWAAFPGQGVGTEPPKQHCHGMAPGSQGSRFAPVTSGCKWHINTGAAEELAATKVIFSSLFNRKTSGLRTMLNVLYASASLDSHCCLLMHGTPSQKLLRGYELLMTQKNHFKNLPSTKYSLCKWF